MGQPMTRQCEGRLFGTRSKAYLRHSAAKRLRGIQLLPGDLVELTVTGAGRAQYQSSTTVITTLPTLRPLSTWRCAAAISARG